MTHSLVSGPHVWLGAEQASRGDWTVHLGSAERAELEAAAERVRATGLQLDDVTAEDFPLPSLAPTLAAARDELGEGRGFVLIRGMPVADYSDDELGVIFWGIGTHLGVGVSQSTDGDRLGHVMDRGRTDRYYTRGGPLVFHVDPVDVVGLLCLRAGKEGGASRIASSLAVHNILAEERPDLLELLYDGYFLSLRAHGKRLTLDRVPVYYENTAGGREAYLLPTTIYDAIEDGAPVSDAQREAMEFVEEVAQRPGVYLDMDFQPGDIQFLNNRKIFHGRTDYVDYDEPALKRHLLRIWLMMPDWPARDPALDIIFGSADRAGGGIRKGVRDLALES